MPNSRFPRLLTTAPRSLVTATALTLATLSTTSLADITQLQQDFLTPPDNARPMVRWWWFGPAVTEQGIDRELNAMKAGGFGGVEVQPTYPLTTDAPNEPKILKFMSPEFLHMLGYASAKAKSLGLRMDLTLGSGWPYGGPMFTANEGAGRIESQSLPITAGETSVPFPKLKPGYSVIAAFLGSAPAEESTNARRRGGNTNADVSSLKPLQLANNAATLPPNAVAQSVTFFIAGRTGMKVKRPADGAEGLVIDHLSSQVVDKFINDIAEPEIKACGDNPPYAVFCDSLEVQGENWTNNFLAEFQKRRGYDLTPHLPALIGNVGPETDAIRYDFGKTVTELYTDNFNARFQSLAHKYNSRFRVQGYGSPPAGLLSYAKSDLPEGELQSKFDFHDFRATRYAASASHLLNVPVTSAETFTWLHTAPFRATPVDFKGEVNIHFIDGINQIICHGWPYTPDSLSYPGASFYAATVVDDKNPWYIGMPALTGYIQRTSAMLREGAPANDIALYLPDADIWSHATTTFSSLNAAFTEQSALLGQLMDAGYNADAIDDGMLQSQSPTTENASLNFGNMHYKIVLLPAITHMPLDTARKLEAFTNAGGTIIALKIPTIVPGLSATDADQKELATIMSHIFAQGAKSIVIQSDTDLPAALNKVLPPDVQLDNQDIAAVHRRTDDAELYFLANASNEPQKFRARFRTEKTNPEEWNLTTGSIRPIFNTNKAFNDLDLTLPPYGSTIIAWTGRTLAPPPALTPAPTDTSIDLSSNWSVTFHPQPSGESKTLTMPTLADWTKLDGLNNFSGTATYQKTFTLPPNLANTPLTLSLGTTKSISSDDPRFFAHISAPVLDVAIVTLNGKNIGTAWCPPYQLDLTGNLKPGENTLQIEVANTAVNAINNTGFPNYDLKAVRSAFGNRFDPQGTQLYAQPLPSGLLGPIQIIPTP